MKIMEVIYCDPIIVTTLLSSPQQSTSISISTSISTDDSSDIDLANLDDQPQLFNHIIDKLSELELNLEKEKIANIELTKSFDSLASKHPRKN